LESAKPAVDQPSQWVDRKEVRKMDVVTLTLWFGPQLPRWSLLLIQTRKYGFTSQRDHKRYLTVYTMKTGN
jgi:hypothetical protein